MNVTVLVVGVVVLVVLFVAFALSIVFAPSATSHDYAARSHDAYQDSIPSGPWANSIAPGPWADSV